jgi:hypothetical protein
MFEWLKKLWKKEEKTEISGEESKNKNPKEEFGKNTKQSKKPQNISSNLKELLASIMITLENLSEALKKQDEINEKQTRINEKIVKKLLDLEKKLKELESRIEKIEKSDEEEI